MVRLPRDSEVVIVMTSRRDEEGNTMPIFTYTTLDDPLGINGTFATGVNASGQVVGSYNDSGGSAHGFLYSGGTYTTFNDPDAGNGGDTIPDGINNLGQVVGTFIN